MRRTPVLNELNSRLRSFLQPTLIGLWSCLTLALAWPTLAGWLDTTPEPRPVAPGGANYVIVAPTGLAESAEAWAAYRRETGYAVRLLVVAPGASTAEQVSMAIQRIYFASGQPYPFYVLLLGHAHPQSLHPDGFLPTGLVAVDVAEFSGYDEGRIASDDAYVMGSFEADVPILVGRVPARSNGEALRVLARTQAYESKPPSGAGRTQVELIASASGFGEKADDAIEQVTTFMADRLLPAEYQWHALWGNPNSPYSYPVAEFPAEVARRLEQGALLAAYIGHGQPDMLGWAVGPGGERGPVFTLADAGRLQDASATLVALTACSAGAHAMAGADISVAEALLLAPGGPAAVYAPSEWIYAIANFRLAQDLFQGLLVDQPATSGEWLSRAEANYANPGADRSLGVWAFHRLVTPFATVGADQRLSLGAAARELFVLQRHAYNLFGDPALKIAFARRDLTIRPHFPWQPFADALAFTGQGSGLVAGQPVSVTLLAPLTSGRPAAADANAATRYTAANDRIVAQTVVAADGHGQIAGQLRLPADLTSGRYRLIAVTDGNGETRARAQFVHLGWPPVGPLLLSPWIWWAVASATLGCQLAVRGPGNGHTQEANGGTEEMSLNDDPQINATRPSKLQLLWQALRFLFANLDTLKALRGLERMRSLLVRANMELGRMDMQDPAYPGRIGEFDVAMIHSTQAKWYTTLAIESRARAAWRQAFHHARRAGELGQQLIDRLQARDRRPLGVEAPRLDSHGTEILFAEGAPLVPAVNPVIILSGSDFELGFQYAQQLVQIFGPWILERKARQTFGTQDTACLRAWEQQLREHAPEILAMCEGWAAGAQAAGIHLTYDQVVDLWTGHLPPAANYLGKGDRIPTIAPPLCSGAAAWGRATPDGRLVAAASGDHDPTFSATLVVFPQNGHPFIYTPFSVVGDVPLLGGVYLMGHPGMNSRGLAYVHHGGDPKLIEPKEAWGYGLRKGASIFHTLRFAGSARDALAMELAYPIGDAGTPVATAGGFYADSTYGYVAESRRDPVLVREAGLMGETDFLYANNSAIHPRASEAGWMQADAWRWDPHGGWHPAEFRAPELFSLRNKRGVSAINALLGYVYNNSCDRNGFLFKMLHQAVGRIDLEYLKMIYRHSGSVPPGAWDEVTAAYKRTGRWGEISTGHAGNALVAVMKPDDGLYALCVSTARRGLTPNAPNPSGGPIYGETNAFWELKLAATPEAVAMYARQKAEECLGHAQAELGSHKLPQDACPLLLERLTQARSHLADGRQFEAAAQSASGNDAICAWSRAVRASTRAQVRAFQVTQALRPPPYRPEDLR